MRRRRKRDIVIELTALLDVIMIMIFMVMKENSKLMVQQQDIISVVQQENLEQSAEIDVLTDQLAEALSKLEEGDLNEILNRLENAESQLEAYQAIDDEVIVLHIELRNSNSNRIRTLSYGTSSDSEVEIESRNDADFSKAVNNLKVFISDYVEQVSTDDTGSTIICIVFSYDPNKVYQRDFEAVESALKAAEGKANSANFRYRMNPVLE